LFAQFGFDGLFLGRVDYQDFDTRGQSKQREMLWQASANLEPSASTIFTGILPNGYNPPPGFCFDTYCTDDPIMDDKSMEDYNVDDKVNLFLNYTMDQSNYYKTKNLIMTMGSDFQYSNAHRWYKNLDKLIFYVNQRQETGSQINIFYSTPACYLYALYRENIAWPTKKDDFFPYAHRPHSFWTGYFTSRVSIKDFVRRTNNYLQSVRQLAAFAKLNDTDTFDSLNILERAMGVAQHHDAVSGTERQHVTNDYAKRLSIGIDACISVISKSFNNILATFFNIESSDANVVFCPLLNISQCSEIEGKNEYTAIIYNPLPRPIGSWVKLPINTNDYTVNEVETGEDILSDAVPIYNEIKSIPERKSQANFNLIFRADLPSLGFRVYTITKNEKKAYKRLFTKFDADIVTLKNQFLQLKFDTSGNLVQIDNLDTTISTPLTQSVCYYNSMPGNNSISEFQASGAYIFRPQKDVPICLNVKKYSLFNGKQFSEIHQIFNDWISQRNSSNIQ